MTRGGECPDRDLGDRARRPLKVRIPPNACFGKSVRDEILAFVERSSVECLELDDFIVAVGEATANAIEHSGAESVIEVRCQIEDDKIFATIVDSCSGFEISPNAGMLLPEALSERGRGLPIMRRCTDIFAVHSVPGKGTTVVLGCYFRRQEDGTEDNLQAS